MCLCIYRVMLSKEIIINCHTNDFEIYEHKAYIFYHQIISYEGILSLQNSSQVRVEVVPFQAAKNYFKQKYNELSLKTTRVRLSKYFGKTVVNTVPYAVKTGS